MLRGPSWTGVAALLVGAASCSPTGTGVETGCGDGVANGEERCDGDDLAGAECIDIQGFVGGTLACRDTCVFDTLGCDFGADPNPFDINILHEIVVELSPESVASIDAEAIQGICNGHPQRSYYSGTVTIDGVTFAGAGVRARGNGTADTLDGKPGLKLNLEWDDPAVPGCPAARTIGGRRKLNLLNMRQDPSFVRIPLASELDRLVGVPQPLAAYGRLTINGAYTGIVVIAENIDRQFLSHAFVSNDGMMYEAGCYCELNSQNVPEVGAPDGSSCFDLEFSADACSTPDPGRDPLDWEALRDFVTQLEALGDFYPGIDAFFDFDGFLSLWAAQMFLGSGDGYFLNQNSYRLYHDPVTDLYAMIDHGSADGIIRTFSDGCSPEGLLIAGTGVDVFTDSPSLLVQRCLGETDCRAAYAARMWEVLHAFETFGIEARSIALHDFIIAEMHDDPRYYYDPCGLGTYTDPELDAHFTDYFLPWVQGRFAEVRTQLEAAGYPEP